MTRVGNQRGRTGEGGVTRGSGRKTGETHAETHTECTRGAIMILEAENSCSYGYRADGRDYSGASEQPESRVEGWKARLSRGDSHRDAAWPVLLLSVYGRRILRNALSIGKLAQDDELAPASRKCVSSLDNRVFQLHS
ncbi:hypothetical protein DFP72DRAFT_1048271 [Ephemerocybe angulata]|uniref:Uncharacterized protein n=1 Tax=Ephemerocybe angulata TaxID=980116 RepID=A0A8H6HPU9_9AGAR|nr:hypothetical protein DFP72DRAFT_1048271 [Tulosesus angulatus]